MKNEGGCSENPHQSRKMFFRRPLMMSFGFLDVIFGEKGLEIPLKFNQKCHLPQGGVSLSNLKLFQGDTLWVSLSTLKPEIIFKVTPYGCHSQTSNM